MKGLKKLLTGVLAATMIMSASITAFAASEEGTELQGQNSEPLANETTNTTTKGSVTVNGCIPGEDYNLYKLLDFESASDNSGVYTIEAGTPWWSFINGQAKVIDGKPTTKTDGVLTLTKVAGTSNKYYVSWAAGAVTTNESRDEALADTAGVQAFAQAAIKFATDNGIKPTSSLTAGKAATDGTKPTVVFDKLSLGYYLVGSSTGALVSLDTTNKNAAVNEKNIIPGSEKKVEEDTEQAPGTSKYGDRNDAEIGQTVNFKSTVTIPAGGAKNVVFYDKMTKGLTFNGLESVVVKNGETTLTNQIVKETNVSVDNETTTFSVKFFTDDTDYAASLANGATITIEYSATVNKDAVIGIPDPHNDGLGEGNDNKSRITYGNKGKTEWDWTRTYVYGFNIFKYGVGNKPLAGAQFELYKGHEIGENAKPVNLVKIVGTKSVVGTDNKEHEANYYRFATDDDETTVTYVETPESGYVYIEGFDSDDYALKEIQAPTGYNLLTAPIKVRVNSDASKQVDTNTNQKISNYSINTPDDEDEDEFVAVPAYTVSIENLTGSLLPSTGGMGTTIFYILGSILIVAGVAYFIVRRKASAE